MSHDTLKMKVDDIRRVLIDEYGYKEDVVHDTKGKAALVEMLNDAEKETAIVDNIDFGDGKDDDGDFVPVNEDEEIEDADIPPIIGSPEWHDHVMSQFTKEELLDGNPTVDGLRRVAEKLIGEIVSIKTDIIQTPEQITLPNATNDRRATAKVTVTFDGGSCFDGAGDVYWGNTDKMYRNFPISVAETRAEGRALKRALRLRKVNAAEELSKDIDHDPSNSMMNDENGLASPVQLRFIDLMCSKDRLNVDAEKLLTQLGMSKATLNYKQALEVNEKLSKFQNQEEKIPEDIVGYIPNWQN